MSFKIQRYFLIVAILLLIFKDLNCQEKKTIFNGFGHQEFSLFSKDTLNGYFSIGEHDFFVRSNISDKISFLGEYVFRFNRNSPTNFLPSIERSFLKINYHNQHAIIAGKIHTPVNYWNDVYHHGRVFFPVIDRPSAFSYFVPLHTLGMQFQGQNMGKLNWGYDVVLGNGISSTDNFQRGLSPSLTAAFHIKPIDGMRIGLSHYYDYLDQNSYGAHSGHGTAPDVPINNAYSGPLEFQLSSFSFAYFSKKNELLLESSINHSKTDTLGLARNWSSFIYYGYKINEKNIPYILFDYLKTAANDLHVYPLEIRKIALGYRHEFNYLTNVKIQIENSMMHHGLMKDEPMHDHANWGLRIQLAYGF
jgi:hypothetical protein